MASEDALSVEDRLAAVASRRQTGGGLKPVRPKPAPAEPTPLPVVKHWHTGGDANIPKVRKSKRQRFLEAMAERGNIGWACEQAGIASRQTIYSWLEHDEQFALQFHQAEARATEVLEAEAFRRGVQGTSQKRTTYYHGRPVGQDTKLEYSDALLTLLLRARAPDKYRETVGLNVSQVIKSIQGFDPAEVLGAVRQ